jgi:hypothetical protein
MTAMSLPVLRFRVLLSAIAFAFAMALSVPAAVRAGGASGGTITVSSGAVYTNSLAGVGTIAVEGGLLRYTGLPDGAWLHIDAARTDTFTFQMVNGTNFITRVDDTTRNGRYASKSLTLTHDRKNPWIEPDYTNGLPVIDFGLVGGSNARTNGVSLNWEGRWSAYLSFSEACTDVGAYFLVFEDRPECAELDDNSGFPTLLGNCPLNVFLRGQYRRMIHTSYCPSRVYNNVVRLNGEASVGWAVPPMGRLNVAVFIPTPLEECPENERKLIGASAFANSQNFKVVGSIRIAEALICTNTPDLATALAVEDYLRKKWNGADVPATNSWSFDSLSIASGAELDLSLAPLNLAASRTDALSGAGTLRTVGMGVASIVPGGAGSIGLLTVDGDLALENGCAIAVDAGGASCDAVAVSGELAISGAGSVAVTVSEGIQDMPRDFPLFTCGTLSGANLLKNWTCTATGDGGYVAKLKAEGSTVYLTVERPSGTLLFVR